MLDGRKTVKMTGRVYVRAIVPIGAAFSLSLICGNLTYLYLSVAFIQMLKVRQMICTSQKQVTDTHMPGMHTCGSPISRLGNGRPAARYSGSPQRLCYRNRHRHRLVRRDQVRSDRCPLSNRRHCFRGYQTSDGGASSQFRRIQDGPPGLAVLLRSSLRFHELLRGSCL